MFQQPMDLVQDVEWKNLRSRRAKRTCNYLHDDEVRPPRSNILLLPQPLPECMSQEQSESPLEEEAKRPCIATNKPVVGSTRACVVINASSIIGLMHVLLNAFIVSALIYTIGHLLYFARIDISYKIAQRREEARVVVDEAKRLYVLNRCDPTTRVPAMESQCGQWEYLIKNGLSGIKYMRIMAEMFADILDGFVGKFSIKSLSVIVAMTAVYLVFRR